MACGKKREDGLESGQHSKSLTTVGKLVIQRTMELNDYC